MSKNNLFSSENDLRRWVGDQLGRTVRWVEVGRGGTFGLPDAFIPLPVPADIGMIGVTVWYELKLGIITEGLLSYHPRREQRQQIKRMVNERIPVFFVVAVQGTNSIVLLNCIDGAGAPAENIISGAVDYGFYKQNELRSKRVVELDRFNKKSLIAETQKMIFGY